MRCLPAALLVPGVAGGTGVGRGCQRFVPLPPVGEWIWVETAQAGVLVLPHPRRTSLSPLCHRTWGGVGPGRRWPGGCPSGGVGIQELGIWAVTQGKSLWVKPPSSLGLLCWAGACRHPALGQDWQQQALIWLLPGDARGGARAACCGSEGSQGAQLPLDGEESPRSLPWGQSESGTIPLPTL